MKAIQQIVVFTLSVLLLGCPQAKEAELEVEPLTPEQMQTFSNAAQSAYMIYAAAVDARQRRSLFSIQNQIEPNELSDRFQDRKDHIADDLEKMRRQNRCSFYFTDPTRGGDFLPINGKKTFQVIGSRCPIQLKEEVNYKTRKGSNEINGMLTNQVSIVLNTNDYRQLSDVYRIELNGDTNYLKKATGESIKSVIIGEFHTRSTGRVEFSITDQLTRKGDRRNGKRTYAYSFPAFQVRAVQVYNGKAQTFEINGESVNRREFRQILGQPYDLTVPESDVID